MSSMSDFLSSFTEFAQDVSDSEQSSDNGSISNSDAEPEMQDFEGEMQDSEGEMQDSEGEMQDSEDEMQDSGDEMQNSEDEMQENNIAKTVDNVVPENQESERNWQHIGPSKDTAIVSRQCSLTTKSEHIQTIDESFHLFIDDEVINNIILHTNNKAKKCMSPEKQWKPVDRTEIDAFLGLLLLIGRYRESKECKHDLWNIDNALTRQFYAATMSQDRFEDIFKYIRFDDPLTREERKADDKLAPLRDITNIFLKNCKNCYNATETGCVSEQLVTFRGRCSFKVYMPSKPGKYGIKMWTLCDSKTFYCCNMDVYLGKHGNAPEKQQGQRVVKQLTNFWKNSNRSITIGNFFTDLSLGEQLLDEKLFLIGTVRKNKRDLPKSLTEIGNRSQYSSEFLFTDKVTLVSYIPKPRKSVILLSTLHHEHNILSATEKFKPDIISYYNTTKSGVDGLDDSIREYSCRQRTRRWPLSLFMHFIDIAAYNAFILYQIKYPTWKSNNTFKMRRKIFLEQLGKRLCEKNIDRRARFENKQIELHKNVVRAIEATGRNIIKKTKVTGQKRARCCFCVGSNNKYATICDTCDRYVCGAHSTQQRQILCNTCNNT
ncbi:hypothetical protein QLX08_004346 [Tetragonisca angustula]|uniref:PiggyBac transposable element-derived protein domain-containing protein n=1 Tax=Tetragonisca angustula TaxID=166442 RepID=A0AAW1A5S4_9HYME